MEKDKKGRYSGETLSIFATKAFIIVLGIGAVLMCIFGPAIVDIIMNKATPLLPDNIRYWVMLIGGYICAALLFAVLFLLFGLVVRIERGEVFTTKNVRSLNLLSKLVFTASLSTFIIGVTCTYMILIITLAASFITSIICVIKHAFAKAVEMKDELDLTV